ncbi:S-layer homology domain-containing protein [Paenibacillaceae bacterium WGS1546]|uniref:S-layer homology domain-containing protein n=1 Tax=Cohnella sp. WGS1546 TaxID=3366810 RepID=UPI00372D3BE8
MSKSIYNRILQWMLIAALVVTMLPVAPSSSKAADPIYFQFRDFSTSATSPTEVNSNLVEIAGTFNSVSSLTYRIEKIVNGQAVEASNSSTQPIITGGNTFRFPGVAIYEGLNRITVFGVNHVGNVVSGVAYVNFSNVPVITEVRLTDGRQLSSSAPLVTGRANEAISVNAPNATNVTINGVEMFGGSGSTYMLNNLGLTRGYNKLVIVARNGTNTYELTRYLVYFNGSLTAYDVTWNGTSLDGNPTFSTPLDGTISSKVIMRTDTSNPPAPAPTFTVELVDETGASLSPPVTSTATYNPADVVVNGDQTTYSITTTGSLSLGGLPNGKYSIKIMDNGTNTPSHSIPFTFRDAASPYITDIRQAYEVTDTGSTISFVSSASFPNNTSVSIVPLWIVLDVANLSAGAVTTTLTLRQNGVIVPVGANFDYATRSTDTGQPAVVINKMPTGNVELTFTIARGSYTDRIVRTVTFVPAPSIQLSSVYNGQVIPNNQLPVIEGKLINFNLADPAELNTVHMKLNGQRFQINTSGVGQIYTTATGNYRPGDFTFNSAIAAGGQPLLLRPGANELIFEGIANGVPISTNFTIYFFSSDEPSIENVRPVPFVIAPELDTNTSDIKRKFNDIDVKFAPTNDKEFTTTETSMDLLFDVESLDTLSIQINGNEVATAALENNSDVLVTADSNTGDTIKLYIEDPVSRLAVPSLANDEYKYKLRLSEVKLPQSGSTNITIIIRRGTVTVTETYTVIRDLSPFQILSPHFPNQSVINSNFLKVSIKAEGADSVVIGKNEMVKGPGDVFRYELKDLKPGRNTIRFTVQQGTQKINGSFVVNYAADNSITAQYKSKLPTSGRLSMFKGDLLLSFPKNTFLRQANRNPGQDVKTIDLFDAQELYFGIADREDGRTVKRYNAVGEEDQDGNFMDGILVDVPVESNAVAALVPQSNFNFASNLYWIDAGYFRGTGLVDDYELIDAMHPYSKTDYGEDFFTIRAWDPNKWLEPSQRGTITIKYDSNIVDAIARNLSIWRYTSQGWVNVGGTVDTKKKTVTGSFDGFGYYAVMSLRYSFSDIGGHSYARLALETMFGRGIMLNKDPNSFGVYDHITRGEFAQILVKMLDVPLEYDPNNLTFDDVLAYDYPDALWNYRYIETAVKKGYIRGRSPRLFWPNDTLTREEASVMIARALNLVKSNADMEKDKQALQKLFTDANTISIYSASSVLAIQKAGYITGIPNTTTGGGKPTYRFEPGSNLTRADTAVIVERIMKKLKKL